MPLVAGLSSDADSARRVDVTRPPLPEAGRRWLECAETAPGRVGVSQPEAPGSRPPDTWHGSERHSESPVEVVGQRVQGGGDVAREDWTVHERHGRRAERGEPPHG